MVTVNGIKEEKMLSTLYGCEKNNYIQMCLIGLPVSGQSIFIRSFIPNIQARLPTTHTFNCMHVYIYIYGCVYIYIYIYMCVCVCVCVCMYVYIYTHTHTHTQNIY